jgi:hypothetical protein
MRRMVLSRIIFSRMSYSAPSTSSFQDDVIERARVLPDPSTKVNGSHLERVLGIECPKATVPANQFVCEESAAIAVLPIQEEILKSLSIVDCRLNETMSRQIRVACRI